ncbi:C-Jun-amino-terminal kinase-interacting protein 3-like [Heptranchias perlo]|uniref:C-Jun-amino-terminal kinase-interacting protein 3-like n=1 Tax=Heptranchias perlo TaxID=212740 RepID=UPI00355ABD2B
MSEKEEENFNSFLSDGLEAGGSDLEGYDEVVSGLAGGLYSELERLILAHGEGAVSGLMPLTVSVLETLEGVCAESRERGAEAALAREENERLLAQYERERGKRKRTEEVRAPSAPAPGWSEKLWLMYSRTRAP